MQVVLEVGQQRREEEDCDTSCQRTRSQCQLAAKISPPPAPYAHSHCYSLPARFVAVGSFQREPAGVEGEYLYWHQALVAIVALVLREASA
jgi:hypothetical protein